MGKAIGIDLGTSYTRVAIYHKEKVEIISNEAGNRATPSYVAFNNQGRLVGEAAKEQTASNPVNTIFNVKRLIGRTFNDRSVKADMRYWPFKVINANGKMKITANYNGEKKDFVPEEITAMVLSKMKDMAESYLGDTVTDAVISVPASFNDSQRQATIDAGTIAGLNVLRIINEPTAAALAYVFDKEKMEKVKKVLVVDWGGGSLDLSVLNIEGKTFEVAYSSGSTDLGGIDVDKALFQYFVQEFLRKHHKDITSDKRAVIRLTEACEKAKVALSVSENTTLEIHSLFEGIDFYMFLTRTQFVDITTFSLERFMECFKPVLSKADITEVDDIIFTGGSMKIPFIQNALIDCLAKLNITCNPETTEEAVVRGAAIQAELLTNRKSSDLKDLFLIDQVSFSHFLQEVEDGSMEIKIYETLVRSKNLLGEFEISDIPSTSRKVNAEIVLDENGILNITTTDKTQDENVGRDKKTYN